MFNSEVEVHSLTGDVNRNRQRGIVRGFDYPVGRLCVHLYDTGKQCAIRPVNVRLVDGGEASTSDHGVKFVNLQDLMG
jgi:hypothetical protein